MSANALLGSELVTAAVTATALPQKTKIDPLLSFRNSQGQSVRGTIVSLQRKFLVMEVYNPYSIVQVSEVLSELLVRLNGKSAYLGKAVVTNIVNTGLTAIVSVTLIDEWRELSETLNSPANVGIEARSFVHDWTRRFRINRDYQIAINEIRAFLAEISRWVEQVDLAGSIPREHDKLRNDYFFELAAPIMEKTQSYMAVLEYEASKVDEEQAPGHRAFAQAALHPLILRAPFVFRTYTKPLGYAGDYQMVNQIVDDPRQGPNTYFQIVNAAFLQAAPALAHRNRIDLLLEFLMRMAQRARAIGRPLRVLNIGCGPAIEIQRFIQTHPTPELLNFDLMDFSKETLAWTKDKLSEIGRMLGHTVEPTLLHDSVHHLLKRRVDEANPNEREYDVIYCAGLFDYLSDKVCVRMLNYIASRLKVGGTMLVTNVHSNNPDKYAMEHLLEWYLIYRTEESLQKLMPETAINMRAYKDATGVNVIVEAAIA